MNPARDASSAFGRLVGPLRERMMVLVAGGVTLLLIVWLGVVDPLVESLATLDRDVARGRDDAATIGDLVGRYRALRGDVDKLEKGAASDQGGASLFAQLESIAVPIAGRERIIAMNPSTRAVGNELQEELVEVRIEGITMRALVSLLYAVESRDPPIAVERLSVKREYKDQSRIDATIVVSRLRPQ